MMRIKGKYGDCKIRGLFSTEQSNKIREVLKQKVVSQIRSSLAHAVVDENGETYHLFRCRSPAITMVTDERNNTYYIFQRPPHIF